MKHYDYRTRGTCSTLISIDYDENSHIIEKVKFTNGCPGNTLGVAILAKGKTLEEVKTLLSGVKCGFKSTSCPDQLSIACSRILSGE